jgi:hypothetical protein
MIEHKRAEASMKIAYVAVVLVAALAVGAQAEAERQWQTGRWTHAGVKRTPFVGNPVHERMPAGFNKPEMTEVATYVIETDDRRYDLQDLVAIGNGGFDFRVTIGHSVTFAVEKKTAYIKIDKGEYRLLVLKNELKKTR